MAFGELDRFEDVNEDMVLYYVSFEQREVFWGLGEGILTILLIRVD